MSNEGQNNLISTDSYMHAYQAAGAENEATSYLVSHPPLIYWPLPLEIITIQGITTLVY
jgi:hypothetical protein